MTLPIGPHGENVNSETSDVIDFLTFVLLDDNLISKASRSNALDSLIYGLTHVDFAPCLVKTISRHTNNEIVTKFLCSLKKPDVPTMN